eukprot:sb/3464309/
MDSSDFDLSDIVQAAYAALDEEELPDPDPDPTPAVPIINHSSEATVTPPVEELRFLTGKRRTARRGEGATVIRLKEHTGHGKSFDTVEAATILSDLKNTKSVDTPANIVGDLFDTASDGVRKKLPLENYLKQRVRRARKNVANAPTSAATAAEITIPEEFTKDGRGLKFLQSDITTSQGKRILIFATDQLLDTIDNPAATICFVDGTFKSASPQFTQIWIIRVCVNELTYPVMYALLENKTEVSYTAVLEFLKRRCRAKFGSYKRWLKLRRLKNAIRRVYPGVRIQGCYFHYTQCIRDRITKFPGVKEDPVLSTLLACFYGIPKDGAVDVDAAFQELRAQLLLFYPTSETTKFTDYFYDTWMKSQHVTSPDIWNVHNTTIQCLPRTNNRSEGGNNALSRAVGASHPSIYHLITVLRRENAKKETRVLQYQQDQRLISEERPRKAWVVRDRNILTQIRNYDPSSKIPFLRNIGHTYS